MHDLTRLFRFRQQPEPMLDAPPHIPPLTRGTPTPPVRNVEYEAALNMRSAIAHLAPSQQAKAIRSLIARTFGETAHAAAQVIERSFDR